ncbi:M42 family peptidase [bacterium CPR1]|nr:M42 family peptidase [bacterium CPR1]
MKKAALEFLQQLVESHGTPGYEQAVQKVFRARLEGQVGEMRTDLMGSVIAVANPKGSPRIMLDGHSDEIGFLVKYIDDKGYLFVVASGGWDAEVIVAQRALVHTASGSIPGVFGKRAIHLMDEEERKKKSELHKMWVDIGATSGDEARELVKLGDSVTMDATLTLLRNGRATSKAFDNRCGLYVVAETLRSLKGKKLTASVHGVSAVQEEIGLRGAQTAAYGINPTIGIAIDVCHATDLPDSDKKRHGDIQMGKGPVIARGPNVNPHVFQRFVEVAEAGKIPYQVEASPRGTGTDANVIQLSRAGVAAGLLSIPLRYMHNPCEMLELDDLDNCVRLLAAFCQSVKKQDDWIP